MGWSFACPDMGLILQGWEAEENVSNLLFSLTELVDRIIRFSHRDVLFD